jgi:CheY-like chemotaxis protein
VLVCDDEGRLAQLTAGLLRHHGFVADAVSDGAAALDRAAGDPSFQVLLLDLNLDGLSSREVVGELAARNPEIRIILTSGYAAEDVPDDLMQRSNVAGYLPKPYPVEKLVSAVRGAVER